MAKPFNLYLKLQYRLKAGRLRVRRPSEAPLIQNIKKSYELSAIGTRSTAFSVKCSDLSLRFWTRVLYFTKLFKVRRTIAYFTATFGACFIGYFISGFGANLYTLGYRAGFVQPSDYSMTVMQGIGQNEKKKYSLQHTQLMYEVLLEKKG